MNRKNMQSYQMLTRTVEFATSHLGLFPKNSAAEQQRKTEGKLSCAFCAPCGSIPKIVWLLQW